MCDFSFEILRSLEAIREAANFAQRPFVALKPKLFPDGNQWCALYGDNIQEGLCGFGDTPALAADDFDNCWYSQKIRAKTA